MCALTSVVALGHHAVRLDQGDGSGHHVCRGWVTLDSGCENPRGSLQEMTFMEDFEYSLCVSLCVSVSIAGLWTLLVHGMQPTDHRTAMSMLIGLYARAWHRGPEMDCVTEVSSSAVVAVNREGHHCDSWSQVLHSAKSKDMEE